MSFCTVINCMDGRVQIPVISFLKQRFNVEYVDSITEPGPNIILSEQNSPELIESIFQRLDISVQNHHSVAIAIVGHHDCAGNPSTRDEQIVHLQKAANRIRIRYPNMEIITLWVDENWQATELSDT